MRGGDNPRRGRVALFIAILSSFLGASPRSGALEANPPSCPDLGEFAAGLAGAIAKDAGSGNILVSPLSLATALGMASLGADMPTRAKFDRLLQYRRGELAADLAACAPKAASDGLTVLAANALWLRPGVAVKPAFQDALRTSFGPSLHELRGQADIDAWIAQATRGMIKGSGADLPGDAALVLTNAIFFDGKWELPFDPRDTQPLPFTAGDGRVADTPTMHLSDRIPFREDEIAQGVQLSYRGPYELVLILPKARVVAPDTIRALADRGWLSAKGFQLSPGTVLVPRFHLDYHADLADMMTGLEGGAAIRAELTEMTAKPMVISAILHAAKMDFDEQGTKAAAVTEMPTIATSARPPPMAEPFKLVVDHPFVIALRNRDTGALLFVGLINHP